MVAKYSGYIDVSLEKVREKCDVCGSRDLTNVIDWDKFPLTEIYPLNTEKTQSDWGTTRLQLDYCQQCSHMQLRNIVCQETLYGHTSDYAFRASSSVSARKSYEFFVDVLKTNINKTTLGNVVEVGCNDLYLPFNESELFDSYLGVDPVLSKIQLPDLPKNCRVEADFFENIELDTLPDVVICKDVLEHVVDPQAFLEKLLRSGNEETLYAVQVTIGETICEGRRFDQVFHQHLNYFSLNSFELMLENLGCELVSLDINYFHWGVGVFLFKRGKTRHKQQKLKLSTVQSAIEQFQIRMQIAADSVQQSSTKGPVYLFGAGLMLSVYGYHVEELSHCVSAIIDDDNAKQMTKCMQLPLPIVSSDSIDNMQDCTIVLGAVSSRANVLTMMKKAIEWSPKKIINPIYEV